LLKKGVLLVREKKTHTHRKIQSPGSVADSDYELPLLLSKSLIKANVNSPTPPLLGVLVRRDARF